MYTRICSDEEALHMVMEEAMRNNASLYHIHGAYVISDEPIAGARKVAPMSEPIRPLVKSERV